MEKKSYKANVVVIPPPRGDAAVRARKSSRFLNRHMTHVLVTYEPVEPKPSKRKPRNDGREESDRTG
jgi:hypothetical protein